MRMHRIFVYGTLMRGESNFSVMRKAKFLGCGTTPGSVYGYGYAPGAVSSSHKAYRGGVIYGELYLVPDSTKEILDELEGVEHGNYTLTDVRVDMVSGPDEGEVVDAQIYFHIHWREFGKYHAGRWKIDY
jgi:gamma-glutamylcyclotransferase (GGCT)/AIG2-like uncharacterized protein YtfP